MTSCSRLLYRVQRQVGKHGGTTIQFVRYGGRQDRPDEAARTLADGYVLERQHTLTSEFLGHDSFGNPQFDTKRTELGELVFRLKNRNDKNTLDGGTIHQELGTPVRTNRAAGAPVPKALDVSASRRDRKLTEGLSQVRPIVIPRVRHR